MLAMEETLFIMGRSFSELVLSNQSCLDEQIQVVVDGSLAYPVVVQAHFEMGGIHVQMFIIDIDFLQNGITFRGLALPVFLKVLREYPTYNFKFFSAVRCQGNIQIIGLLN